MKRALTAVFLGLLFAAGTLWAGIPINERRDLSRDGLVEVELVAGTVTVTGWDKSELELTGTIGDPDHKLNITGGKDRINIEIELPKGTHHDIEESDLVLRVPKGCRLNVQAVSGPISVSDLTGRIELNSVSGDLEVKGSPREVQLNTVSGRIALDDGASLENANFNTVSGTIDANLDFRSGGSFEFNTVSGNITLALPGRVSAEFEVTTFSGNIVSDFGDEPVKKSSFLPSEELEFTLGSGGARVKVNSFSGLIKIVRE
jgi:DUF4097 and DUF4098 domain-containing protein YvlB